MLLPSAVLCLITSIAGEQIGRDERLWNDQKSPKFALSETSTFNSVNKS